MTAAGVGRSGRVAVLVAAAGAAWEAAALERLERAGPSTGVVLARRCVDLSDLLAAAVAGGAAVAVASPALPGLDADSVQVLQRSGLGVVLVAAPEELAEGDAERLRRLGVDRLMAATELDSLVAELVAVAGKAADTGVGRGEPTPPAGTGAPTTPSPGRVVAVWGPTGAPGRTTVAVGLATELAPELARRPGGGEVLLVDADGYGGAVGQHLGVLEEVSGLLAAARAANAGQLDCERLAGLARRVGPGLRVLTGLPRPDRWQEVRPAAFEALLEEAAGLADLVVLDVGFSLEADPGDTFGSAPQRNQMTLTALERADEVVVVGAADPVGLARLARGLVELHELLPAARPRVVVNRTRPSLGWTDREIRGMVEGFVQPLDVHFLPEDRAAADRALMAGRSLAEQGDSPLRSAVVELARHVAGGSPVAPRSARARLRRRRAGRAR